MYSVSPDHHKLEQEDPLYIHLKGFVAAAGNCYTPRPDFEISPLGGGHSVFLCRETGSGSSVVCKFFSGRYGLPQTECCNLLNHEFSCLRVVRLKGLDQFPLAVVRPLGKVEELGCLLAEEFVPGHSMDYYIAKAAHEGRGERLSQKLDLLADFFSKLHQATLAEIDGDTCPAADYFDSIVHELQRLGVITRGDLDDLLGLSCEWRNDQAMRARHICLVHGDATPTNFIFNSEDGVTAIDLERMHAEDPMYDIGMFAAELKHHFALRILDADASESYIGRFLRRYCDAYSSEDAVFEAMTYRSRFFMALGEIRIARNPWLPAGHRSWLAKEARRCLMQ